MTRFKSTLLPKRHTPEANQRATIDLLDKINRLSDSAQSEVDAVAADVAALGGTWHPISDPATGWIASKTSGWTADSFSGGLTVDFTGSVPSGTSAVSVLIFFNNGAGEVYSRRGSDPSVSDTPSASDEKACIVAGAIAVTNAYTTAVVWLSSSLTADFAATNTSQDVYISYPRAYIK